MPSHTTIAANYVAAQACSVCSSCDAYSFVRALSRKLPVELPDTTPIYSNAEFGLPALAMERDINPTFATILSDRILQPLGTKRTGLLSSDTRLAVTGYLNIYVEGEQAAVGM